MIKVKAICLWNYHNKTHGQVYYFGQLTYAKTKLMEDYRDYQNGMHTLFSKSVHKHSYLIHDKSDIIPRKGLQLLKIRKGQ